MAAVVIEIADAVTAALNAASLSMPFTAERLYVPRYRLRKNQPGDGANLPDLDTLRVSVVPRELEMAALTRRSHDFTYLIDVAVQRRLGDVAPTTVDPYMRLVEEIGDVFRGKRLDGYPDALCVGVANVPVYSPEHLDEAALFVSLLTLTFRAARDQTP